MKRLMVVGAALAAGLASAGQLKLDQYYDSGAVFQRGVKIPVRYGWTSPERTNFADAEGRPVGAFRSDNGKLATQR